MQENEESSKASYGFTLVFIVVICVTDLFTVHLMKQIYHKECSAFLS